MGCTASSSICFGVKLDDIENLPWEELDEDNMKKYDELDQWWAHVNDQDWNNWDGFDKWIKDNPLPVELVMYDDYEGTNYILAFRDTHKCSKPKDPTIIHQDWFNVSKDKFTDFWKFCKKYEINITSAPDWCLTCIMGW